MPAGLATPIGNRFYDWKYESEPEPHMNGRRIYHARGKVLGGSSSINGMIFQRGNPLDYERWAGDPGMETLGLRALPAVLQADGELPRAAPTSSGAGTGRSCSSAARRRARSSRRSSRPCQQAGYPLTDDVNGYRQEGFASVRPQHPPRPAAQRGPRLPAPGHEPARTSRCAAARSSRGCCFEGTRAVGVEIADEGPERIDGRRGDPLRRRDQLAAAAAALRRRQRRASSQALGRRRRARPARASARTCRTTSRSTSSTRARSRSRCSRRSMKWRNRPWIGFQWLFFRTGPGRDESLRGGRLHPLERRGRLPEPDVPLPAARDPLRRLQARGRPRLPGARRPDVLGRPRP